MRSKRDINLKKEQVKECLERIGPANVEQLAKALNIELTQSNRKVRIYRIRRLARQVVDENDGMREERDENKNIIYSL